MPLWIYKILDYFFIIFHTALILFNLFGWIWKQTRIGNFITLNLTAFSWFVLGIWYGWGYCFCTDWHWQVRQHLGELSLEHSYIAFLIRILTGLSFNESLVDMATGLVFAIVYVISWIYFVRGVLLKKNGVNEYSNTIKGDEA